MGEKTKKINPKKVEAVDRIKQVIQSSRDLIFTDYRGLNVQQITDLRRQLRRETAEFKVIKNNFARIALTELGQPFEESFLQDPTALAFVHADIGPVARLLFNFTRETPLRIKGATIQGRAMGPEAVETISRLPGRLQLYALLMGVLKAPTANLVYVLGGVTSKLVRTLQAVAEAKAREATK